MEKNGGDGMMVDVRKLLLSTARSYHQILSDLHELNDFPKPTPELERVEEEISNLHDDALHLVLSAAQKAGEHW